MLVRALAQVKRCANMPMRVLLPHLIYIGLDVSMLYCILHILISCQLILLCLYDPFRGGQLDLNCTVTAHASTALTIVIALQHFADSTLPH